MPSTTVPSFSIGLHYDKDTGSITGTFQGPSNNAEIALVAACATLWASECSENAKSETVMMANAVSIVRNLYKAADGEAPEALRIIEKFIETINEIGYPFKEQEPRHD